MLLVCRVTEHEVFAAAASHLGVSCRLLLSLVLDLMDYWCLVVARRTMRYMTVDSVTVVRVAFPSDSTRTVHNVCVTVCMFCLFVSLNKIDFGVCIVYYSHTCTRALHALGWAL